MSKSPKNLEAYYDLIEPGADKRITEMLNNFGSIGKDDALKLEEKSLQSELSDKERRALQDFRANFKLAGRIKRFIQELSQFIKATGVSEMTLWRNLLESLNNGDYDKDLYEEYPNQIGKMSVVIPAFNIEDFLECAEILSEEEGVIAGNMTIEMVYEQVNKKFDELEKDIKIAKDWHREYQKGIRAGAEEIDRKRKQDNE